MHKIEYAYIKYWDLKNYKRGSAFFASPLEPLLRKYEMVVKIHQWKKWDTQIKEL